MVCTNGALYSRVNSRRPPLGKRGDPDIFACPNPKCKWTAKSYCIRFVTNKDFNVERKVALKEIKEGIALTNGYDMDDLSNDQKADLTIEANNILTSVARRVRCHLEYDGTSDECKTYEIPLAFRKKIVV